MAIVVPGYSSTDRIPRTAFALLLGQGSRTPAASPLDILLIGPRSNTGTGSETFEINGAGPKTIVVTSLVPGITWKLADGGAAAASITAGCVTLTCKNDDSTTVTAMQALIAGAAEVAECITITGTGGDTFDNAKVFATARPLCSAEGSASDDDPKQLYSVDDADDYFGTRSPVARMAERLFGEYPGATVWGICADDNATCTAGTHIYSITGTATETRTLQFAVGDECYEVSVVSGDTNDTVGTALAAAINADAKCPCRARYSNASNILQLTHAWNGPEQGFTITVLTNVAGITIGAPSDVAGTGEPDFATALGAAFAAIPSIDYVVPSTNDLTTLTSGATSLKGIIATDLAPTVGLLVTAVIGHNDDTTTNAHAMTDAWDDGTITYSETGYWSQDVWASNYPAEPWCVAAAMCGMRVRFEEINPQRAWDAILTGGDVFKTLGACWLASQVPAESELNTAIQKGITPIRYEWSEGRARCVLSVTCKHQLGSTDDLTYLENTNIPATCRTVSYGIRSQLAATFSGFSVVADVDGEPPDELPTRTTSPLLMTEYLIVKMKEYQALGYVQKAEEHRDVTSVEQDATTASRLLYELPIDVPRWVTQIVGVHREIGG